MGFPFCKYYLTWPFIYVARDNNIDTWYTVVMIFSFESIKEGTLRFEFLYFKSMANVLQISGTEALEEFLALTGAQEVLNYG